MISDILYFRKSHNTALLPPPPPTKKENIYIAIVFDFSWVIFMSQEKSNTIMQNFGGVNKMYYGICESREFITKTLHAESP